ncbi:hypothetical protein, partial [Burkholderia cenocepacia]|uniref:hypothetical protein n=2 Tax=Burkholderia cenocepacia TaxID=95486 RepID=UPI001C0AE3D2
MTAYIENLTLDPIFPHTTRGKHVIIHGVSTEVKTDRRLPRAGLGQTAKIALPVRLTDRHIADSTYNPPHHPIPSSC